MLTIIVCLNFVTIIEYQWKFINNGNFPIYGSCIPTRYGCALFGRATVYMHFQVKVTRTFACEVSCAIRLSAVKVTRRPVHTYTWTCTTCTLRSRHLTVTCVSHAQLSRDSKVCFHLARWGVVLGITRCYIGRPIGFTQLHFVPIPGLNTAEQ